MANIAILPTNPRHTLKDQEKKAYLDAELCLMTKPSKQHLRGSRTIFDDFQSAHALKTEIAHFVVCFLSVFREWPVIELVTGERTSDLTLPTFTTQGQFLPFHRLFLHAHEKALETECGYTGGQP